MASSQILIYILAGGGFILLAFLLVYFAALFLRLWRKQPMFVEQHVKARRANWLSLLTRFSESLQFDTPELASSDVIETSLPVPDPNWQWLGILLLAIAIDILAEFSLILSLQSDANANIQGPMLSMVVAGALFVFISQKAESPSIPAPFKAILPERVAPPAALWLTNLGLSIVLLNSFDFDLPNWANYLLFGVWLVNILLFCWNVGQMAHVSLPSREAVNEWWQAHRWEVLLVALIGLAALLIRVIGLETYPYAFMNDEAEVGGEAQRILWGEKSAIFGFGWSGNPALSFLLGALPIKLLGNTAFAVRLLSAVQGTLAVIFVYLLAREAFDRPIALFAACLLTALPWEVHFSRLGVMNIGDSMYSAGVLWLTYRALRRGSYIDYLAAGLITGVAFYAYLGSRLVIAMAIGVLGYAALRQRDYLRTHFRHLAIFVFAFLIVASPMMLSFSRNANDFMGRIYQESILNGNNLEELSANANMQPFDFIVRQVQVSTTVFIATPAGNNFFDAPRPYLAWWAAIFLIFGMVYALWHSKQVRYIMLLGWFWAPILLGSALTFGPPTHQRMLGAAPALVLLVALGLWKFAQSIQLSTGLPIRWFLVVCVLFVGFTAWQDLQFYFVGEFRTDHHFEVEGNELSYEVGMRAHALGPGYQMLLIGEPMIFADFADFHYLTAQSNLEMDVQNFNSVTPETIANLPRERGIFFVAIPSRVEELKMVAQQLPGGQWEEAQHRTREGISYYDYILPGISATP
jgi:4-amino-4-deoxy-L-arabinose transferase-like glycosyltransferase